MRNFLKALLRPVPASIWIAAAASVAFASSVSLLTGPQPAADLTGILNGLIVSMNSAYGNAGPGSTSSAIYVPTTTNAVNLFSMTPGATGVAPLLSAGGGGSDTNIGIVMAGKGTGAAHLGGTTTANASVRVPTVASAVNEVQLEGSVTTAPPLIHVGGSGADTNVGLAVYGNGTGSVYLGGATAATAAASVAHGSANVNQIVLTGTNTGTAPSITLGGSGADANRNLSIQGSGTGIVTLGQTMCTASGSSHAGTCNGQRGIYTTESLSTAHDASQAEAISNSSVTASSLVLCTIESYSGTFATNGIPVIACVPSSGTITATVSNAAGTNALNGTVGIGFVVFN